MSLSRHDHSEVQLGELCERVTVGHVGPMADQYRPAGTPFLRSQDIEPFLIRTEAIKFIGEDFNRKLKKSALAKNDVVIVRTGYPGTAAVVPAELDGANCADLVILTPGPNLDAWFVAALLNSAWGRGAVAGNLVGVAQQHFNVGAAKSLRFRPPDISVQRRIGGIIRAYCDLIEVNTRRIAILEEIARRLFAEWFIKFRPAGMETAPKTQSSLGTLPVGWTLVPISSLVEFSKGRKPAVVRDEPEPGDTRLLLIDALRGRKAAYTAPAKLILASPRDTIMVMDGASSCRVAIGHAGAVGSTLGRFKVTNANSFSPHALYRFFEAKTEEFSSKNVGAAIPHANKDYIVNQLFPLPSPEINLEFHRHLEPIQASVDILKAQTRSLAAARDLLLPKLISGEIDLEHAERGAEAIARRVAAE